MNEPDVTFWTDAIDRVFNASSATGREGETIGVVRTELLPAVQARLRGGEGDDLAWLASALGQPGMSLGVAVFFWRLGWMPEALFDPMIAAAVDAGEREEASPDAPRPFVAACRTTIGPARIETALRGWRDRGSPGQRRAAGRALEIAGERGD